MFETRLIRQNRPGRKLEKFSNLKSMLDYLHFTGSRSKKLWPQCSWLISSNRRFAFVTRVKVWIFLVINHGVRFSGPQSEFIFKYIQQSARALLITRRRHDKKILNFWNFFTQFCSQTYLPSSCPQSFWSEWYKIKLPAELKPDVVMISHEATEEWCLPYVNHIFIWYVLPQRVSFSSKGSRIF